VVISRWQASTSAAARRPKGERWLRPSWRLGRVGGDALEAPDFSATTDLYSIVANVYQLRLVPVEVRSLLILLSATLLPFVPVLLMAVPLDTLLQRVAGLLH
jgi:hypothetical protein